ncbi:uncharacterized protein G2W53_015283 [Senna tora]|uniref:Uncharacterized protein n=1 Tax=Senna tora TaxID=362788 RepID=A0A835C7B0_9FABA|nr:uncharacterized protein G2W53_015283 [Senna tora]
MQKCFGRVKEKKPSPPRKRKSLVWSNDDFVKTTVVECERIGISKDVIKLFSIIILEYLVLYLPLWNYLNIDNDFDISRLSFVLPLMLRHSHRRQKLSPPKEDPWPPDRSLGAVVSLHQISRCCRLVTADLAGENAEVLWESEGEEASAAAEDEVFGLEVNEGNLLLYSV